MNDQPLILWLILVEHEFLMGAAPAYLPSNQVMYRERLMQFASEVF